MAKQKTREEHEALIAKYEAELKKHRKAVAEFDRKAKKEAEEKRNAEMIAFASEWMPIVEYMKTWTGTYSNGGEWVMYDRVMEAYRSHSSGNPV